MRITSATQVHGTHSGKAGEEPAEAVSNITASNPFWQDVADFCRSPFSAFDFFSPNPETIDVAHHITGFGKQIGVPVAGEVNLVSHRQQFQRFTGGQLEADPFGGEIPQSDFHLPAVTSSQGQLAGMVFPLFGTPIEKAADHLAAVGAANRFSPDIRNYRGSP
jgi:hypothetical protein